MGNRAEYKLTVRLGLVALILAVFGLYVHHLGRQSLWFDEGLSVVFAARPLPQLFSTLVNEDLHPPLYYLLLHFWMLLTGDSEWAVRFPSVLAACLMLPLAFAVVREVAGQESASSADAAAGGTGYRAWVPAGIAAAALVGSSPFIAYYAQETRMYSLAAMLSLASTWSFLRALRCGESGRVWWGLFSVSLAASLYTQYFAAFVIPAFLLYAALLERGQLRRTILYTLLAGLLYAPWFLPACRQLGRLLRAPDYWVTTRIDPVTFLRAVWVTFLPSASARGALLAAVVALLLLLRLARSGAIRLAGPLRRGVLVFLTFLSPMALTYLVVSLAPKFVTRYAITAAAPLYICAVQVLNALVRRRGIVPVRGAGTFGVSRVLFGSIVLMAVIVSLGPTIAITSGQREARDDARGISAYLTTTARPEDALLLVEYAPYALQYYYRGAAPWYGLHVGTQFQGGADVLNRILQTRRRRIWLVLWHHEFADPTDMVVTELLRIGHEVKTEGPFHGYTLRAFDIDRYDVPIQASPAPGTRLDMDLTSGVHLLGYDRLEAASGRMPYVFYWQTNRALETNYSLTLSLEDLEGTEYMRLDQALSTPYFLPPAWPLHTLIRGRVEVPLRADLPAKSYRVVLRVFDPALGRNVEWVDGLGQPLGQAIPIEEVALAKSDMIAEPVSAPNQVDVLLLERLRLVGFDLGRGPIHPGDTVLLALWWQTPAATMALGAGEGFDGDASVRVILRDGAGGEAWSAEKPLVAGCPASSWRAAEVNRVLYRLAIPSHLSAGDYSLSVGLGREQPGQGQTDYELSSLRIVEREHRYDVPPIQHTLGAVFEQGITLLGYDLASTNIRPGMPVTITLYWRTSQEVAESYKVSLQILAPGPRIVVQDDSVPARWTYPTTAWLPGEVIQDEHTLAIPRGTQADSCTVIVALYNERTATRLTLTGDGSGDYAVLSTVRISP